MRQSPHYVSRRLQTNLINSMLTVADAGFSLRSDEHPLNQVCTPLWYKTTVLGRQNVQMYSCL